MIRFKQLAIQGFRSFKRDTVLSLEPYPTGLYLISGENRIEPELGANGAGKSSIWDALTWVLYGKTARGLRAKAVANWDEEDLCSVCLEFERDGTEYAVTRSWNPNALSLQVEGQEPDIPSQEDLEKLIGVDYYSFLFTVLMGQFNTFFFDLSPTDKLEVFSTLLHLDDWEDLSARARALVQDTEAEAQALAVEAEGLRGRLKSLADLRDEISQKRDEWEGERGVQLRELGGQLRKAKAARAEARQASQDCAQALRKAEAESQAGRQRRSALAEELAAVQNRTDSARRTLAARERELEFLRTERARVVSLVNEGVCPDCQQDVSSDHGSKLLHNYDAEIGNALPKVVKAGRYVEEVKGELTTVSRQLAALEQRLEALARIASTASAELARREAGVQHAQQRVSQAREAVRQCKRHENPHVDTLKKLSVEMTVKENELEDHQRAQRKAERNQANYKYWAKGFKDLRLWLVDRALLDLEILVNSSLLQLGLNGWTVRFDVERAKADGGVTRGFSVFINAPGQDQSMPWESWSGGETQRLRIAGAIGLSSLICARLGFDSNLEVWDEPTAHLSQNGINDLLAFFASRARDTNRQVWMVDHRSLIAGDFEDQILVVKDESGSRIVQRR